MEAHGTYRSMSVADRTPAQLYALVLGAVLVVVGIVGFAVNSSFETGAGISGDNLLFFEVNGWHNIVHLASGLVALAVAAKPSGARLFALGFGAVYLAVAIIGMIESPIVNLLAANSADHMLHLAIAAAGIGAGLASTPRNSSV